jgi:membrane-associated phospholipid phosphatase
MTLRRVGSFFRQYPHWKLLLYWPLYGASFELLEWLFVPSSFHVMECTLDRRIPFLEIFIIPYLYWFVALIAMHLYTFFKDPLTFRKLMRFIVLTQTTAVLIFIFFPTQQLMRPATFPRENILSDMVGWIYQIDTNTNVCPSLHVIGAVAVWFTSMHCKPFQKRGWQIFFFTSTMLICASTVFIKQHSLIDVTVALCICAVAYPIAFGKRADKRLQRKLSAVETL